MCSLKYDKNQKAETKAESKYAESPTENIIAGFPMLC